MGPTTCAPDRLDEAAEAAGLVYLHGHELGICRRRSGTGFSYHTEDGALVRRKAVLRRIRSLAIPPAWTEVRISARSNTHLQAIGLDSRGRRQYRYHPRYRVVRDAAKFEHVVAFAAGLPALRAQVDRDLAEPGLGRERVLATVVRLLETTMIRVGGAEYAKANHSYGVATLRQRHVDVHGGELRFHFTGKGGKEWRVGVNDRRLARVVRACHELPGQALFQYVDEDGERRSVSSSDVNDYLKTASGADITAKDFRTWFGTVLAALALDDAPPAEDAAAANRRLKSVVKGVSKVLGNTPAISLKCYIHPKVVEAYLAGTLALPPDPPADGLSPEERRVLAFLRGAPIRKRNREASPHAVPHRKSPAASAGTLVSSNNNA